MKKRYINALLVLAIIISTVSASAISANAAIRRVIEGDHPILHEKCEKVVEYDERLHDIISDLFDTIKYCGADCAGLAAPEVGVNKQVCVIDDGCKKIVMVNPEIIEQSGATTSYEGCECLPGQFFKISRPEHIVVKYNDENGNPVTLAEDGFLARVICHEIDHLNGILITDYQNMFEGCTPLEDVPHLPAKDLKPSEYNNMFSSIPDLSEDDVVGILPSGTYK